MSLVRIAARIALVEALKGRTLAGDNVKDSDIGAIDIAADGSIRTGQDQHFIVVYADAAAMTREDGDLRSLKENGATDLLFEWGITSAMSETNAAGESVITDAGLAATDANMERVLDLIGVQIRNVLTDPVNAWAEIWRTLASGGYAKVELARASNADAGVRLTAQQLKITALLMDEPVAGEALPAPFPDFFDRLDTSGDASLVQISALMQAQLVGANEAWQTVQRRSGLTLDELLALGIAPLETDDGSVGEIASVSIEVEGHGSEEVSEA
ncbi:MAG: hypothetical protein KDJ90_06845 [Nitratireductor sp.]|nr:hypothetical protein [Nitratireductor sp.]